MNLPIFQSCTFLTGEGENPPPQRYMRLSNTPNHLQLAEKIAQLEGTESALVTASGMAAIATALLTLVPQGGHVLAPKVLYGGTLEFFKKTFLAMGRSVSYFESEEELPTLLRSETAAIYSETLTNPMLRIPDHPKIVAFAKREGLVSLIDNTLLSPAGYQAIAQGYDVILHSATKFLNGHSDLVGGAICGTREVIQKTTQQLNLLGGCMDTHTCFLLNRGIKTLYLRVKEQNRNAQFLAEKLEGNAGVERVIYPGLASHPDHERAKSWFRGFGSMLCLELAKGDTDKFLRALKIPFVASSLGSVETLVTRPYITTHGDLSKDERAALGISERLVRISVGIEDATDLLEDFERAILACSSG